MTAQAQWLIDIANGNTNTSIDGLVPVAGYKRIGRRPEEVAMMEKAEAYGAHSVFFEASRNDGPPIAQAFIFISGGPTNDKEFAELHKRLWSWGRVPLIYRTAPGLIQLFRCAHKPDFASKGDIICKPIKTLKLAAAISKSEAWWDASQLYNGTIWDDPVVCKTMMSASKAAHKQLINAVRDLNDELNQEGILKKHLRRRLLILSLLIAYLEERGAFLPDYFSSFLKGAEKFFEVLANGPALVALLEDLEERFNGHVFVFDESDRETLQTSTQLSHFAKLIEAHEEPGGQLTLWQLYSFRDLPVELISHIYQLFVNDESSSVYTPPFLVRLMLEEALSWERLDRLQERNEIILDPCCGSGVFLVEAYKRLVLHWRSRNEWKRPGIPVLKRLLKRVHGIDLENGAVELAAFSLCLSLCDALEPEEIRSSIKLFPRLADKTLHKSCFFEAKEKHLLKESIGVIVGNPPFKSNLNTEGAQRSYEKYEQAHGLLPDKQLGYLFLHEAMRMLAEGGLLSMLQQYNFLYNQQSLAFRRDFLKTWNVREVLDFISVRGLFQKGGADTKVIVVLAEANPPSIDQKILHATFRRSGRIDAEQGFDIDYYDLHWVPHRLAVSNDGVWRANLLGGGRLLTFVDRLKTFQTLGQYAKAQEWDFGEGFIEGGRGISRPADHIVGHPLLRSHALTAEGINEEEIIVAPQRDYEAPRSEKRFTAPMLLIKQQMEMPHALWVKHYLTYTERLVGFCAPEKDAEKLTSVNQWLTESHDVLQAYVALISPSLFIQKATAIQPDDIYSIPYPAGINGLDLSANEQILVEDVVGYYRDLIRLGEDSAAMTQNGHAALKPFNKVFLKQINTVYRNKPLQVLESQVWPGVICQPFAFGNGTVDWDGADELKDKIQVLLQKKQGDTLNITRISRVYDEHFVFLLKPDRLRYWLRSIALRDADEVLADLRMQGF